jgi:hypothetical protein
VADHDRGVHVDDQHVQIATGGPSRWERLPVMGLGVLGPRHLPRSGPRGATAASAASSRRSSSLRQVESDANRPEQRRLIGEDSDLGHRRGAVGDRNDQIDQYPTLVMPSARATKPAQHLG